MKANLRDNFQEKKKKLYGLCSYSVIELLRAFKANLFHSFGNFKAFLEMATSSQTAEITSMILIKSIVYEASFIVNGQYLHEMGLHAYL